MDCIYKTKEHALSENIGSLLRRSNIYEQQNKEINVLKDI
jgi:hypothetical protein